MSGPGPRPDLDELLGRWVAEGWIEAAQAARIRAGEAARTRAGEAANTPDGEAANTPDGEAANTPDGEAARTPAAVPAPAPATVPRRAQLAVEALGYLGGLLAITGVLADQVWDFSAAGTTLAAAGLATPYAALLWWRTRAPLQHLAMFAGAAVVTGSGIAILAPGTGAWLPGLGVWVLSLAWGVAAHLGYLPPRDTGYLAAGIGLLVGAQMTMQEAVGY